MKKVSENCEPFPDSEIFPNLGEKSRQFSLFQFVWKVTSHHTLFAYLARYGRPSVKLTFLEKKSLGKVVRPDFLQSLRSGLTTRTHELGANLPILRAAGVSDRRSERVRCLPWCCERVGADCS